MVTLLSSEPYFDALRKRRRQETVYTVSIHADMVKIHSPKMELNELNKPTATRGSIGGFSRKSRKRMIECLADEQRIPDLFVTLTLDDSYYENWQMFYRSDFEAFRRRLERNYDGISAVWRLELEKRKSGMYIGQYMPHFHILVWLPDEHKHDDNFIVDEQSKDGWNNWWHEITGCTDEVHRRFRGCDISRIKSRRHAYHYVSKYAAKEADDELFVGRRWGRIGTVGQGSRADIMINKQTYIELKRLITSYWKRRKPNLSRQFRKSSVSKGLTIFGFALADEGVTCPDDTIIVRWIKHARDIALDKLDEHPERNYHR